MSEEKKMSKSKRLYIVGVVIAALAIAIATIGGIAAKYIYQKDGENVVRAKEFYFTSDLLREDGAEYVLNSTATSVSFTLGNNFDAIRYSEDDIKYTVTVEVKDANDKEGKIEKTYALANGTLTGGSVQETSITLTDKFDDLVKGKLYSVTAVGQTKDEDGQGYKQTLTATFEVSDNEENVYKYVDTPNHAYILLTVWTKNVKGTAQITCGIEGLIPDNTDAVLQSVNNFVDGKYGTIETPIEDAGSFVNTYSSRTYRFFIDTATDVDAGDFGVKLIDGAKEHLAEVATP